MDKFDIESPSLNYRVILKNKHAFAFLSKAPIIPGHVLISPIQKVVFSEGLSQDQWKAILQLKAIVCPLLRKTLGAEGFNFAWNEGEMAGQTVSHFHLHVVPRKLGDTGIWQYDPRVFLYRPGSRAISPEQELKELTDQLKGHL